MIIFTPIKDMPLELLEQKGIRQVVKYNLSSYYSDVQTLNALIPSTTYVPQEALNGDVSSFPAFDVAYNDYIFRYNDPFIQFMNIIIPVYTSPDTLVQILIGKSEFRDAITETLSKLIQQRYGYNVYMINEIEDFIYTDESTFSIPGLFILDQDLQRWRTLMLIPDGTDMYA